jgi:hypothetical protein
MLRAAVAFFVVSCSFPSVADGGFSGMNTNISAFVYIADDSSVCECFVAQCMRTRQTRHEATSKERAEGKALREQNLAVPIHHTNS